MSILTEFLMFLRERKRYWLWPFVLVVLMLSLFLFLAQGTALSTFIYSLF
ncbi:hypothetical protein C8P68_10361 [Mucilaginibacter yixingensis]|uniref:Uncharacterized protein n=1 Tax=Mucilaginibacter yixingensis TaxID=1295612 RepID=A0A2T5JAJ8_9SPHI|nr:DUF5989 family protein [Mucilaginibacter yixingensis]PTQ97902.1 hypothetical protein C8P68_10361 [Mucilaginibacter yixingensis]